MAHVYDIRLRLTGVTIYRGTFSDGFVDYVQPLHVPADDAAAGGEWKYGSSCCCCCYEEM